MVDHPPQPAEARQTMAQRLRRLVQRPAVAGPLALGLLVILLLACVLWIPRWLYPSLTDGDLRDVRTAQDGPDAAKVQELKDARLKLQNDARTTLLQGLGAVLVLTGAGIGASMTLRQVRATRDQIRETATASRNQLKLSEQGLVTDRYTRAVEQLGHEKAPVRLGALYSLEHLAQDNPEYRQTVVDVVCAYLRMPYTPPAQTEPGAKHGGEAAPPAKDGTPAAHPAPRQDPAQELQVRQTAQQLLAKHLQLPKGTSSKEIAKAQTRQPSPQQAFWPGISLDLTGAFLVNFDFLRVSVVRARFDRATFQGPAWFDRAAFQHQAMFRWATFRSSAMFSGATFQNGALFWGTTFQRAASFFGATFQRAGTSSFAGATFHGQTVFAEATFADTHTLGGAKVPLLHDPIDEFHSWPDGYTIDPDPADPTRGTLTAPFDSAESAAPAGTAEPTE